LLVACLPGKAHTFANQSFADAESARRRFYQQKPQLGNRLGFPDQKYRSDHVALPLGNPATLTLGVKVLNEFGYDLRDQGLKALIVLVLLGIENPMPMDYPTISPGCCGRKMYGVLGSGCEPSRFSI